MTEQKIKFSIGTEYNGEGLLRAKNGIQQLNRSAGQTAGALSQFANAFGGIDAKCAAATKAITGVMNAFVNLNPVMLGVTAAAAAFTWGIEQCNKKQEEAKARADALKASLVKLWDVGFNPNLLKQISDEMKNVSAEFDRTAKLANTLEAAMSKMKGAKGANEIAQLEVEKANASFAALDDAQRQMTEAYYDAEIAQKKLDQTKAQQAEAIDTATKAVYDAESRLQISRDAISKMNDELDKLNAQYEWIYGNEEAEKDIKKRIIDVEKAIETAKTEEETRLNDLRIAIANEQTARISATTAISNAENVLTKTIKRHEDLQEALEKRRAEEEAAAEAARQNKEAEERATEYKLREEELTNDLNEMLAKDIKTQEGLNAAKEKMSEVLDKYANDMGDGALFKKIEDALTKMQKKIDSTNAGGGAGSRKPPDYEKALANYNANLNANLFNDALNAWQPHWGLDNSRWVGGDTKKAGQVAVDQGRANGTIRTSADEHRVRMAAERAQRDYNSSKEARQTRADEAARQKLQDKQNKGIKLSQKEKEKLDNFNKNKEARDKAAKELAEAEKAQKEAAQNIQKMQKDVEQMKDLIKDKLGLK